MKPIQLKHPINPTSAKFTLLVESMQRDGWVGRPVLVYETSDDMAGDYLQALTGSYRIAAARKLGIDPEVLVIADEPLTDSAREIAELFVGDDTRGINYISELLSLVARHHTDEVMVRMLKSLFGVDHPATRLLAQEVEEEEEEEERREEGWEEEEGEGGGVFASASAVPAKEEPVELEDLEEEEMSCLRNLRSAPTSCGFQRFEFRDVDGDLCSIQESSDAVVVPKILFGLNGGRHVGVRCMTRMHLTQADVVALLPLLQHFAITGKLPKLPADHPSGQG